MRRSSSFPRSRCGRRTIWRCWAVLATAAAASGRSSSLSRSTSPCTAPLPHLCVSMVAEALAEVLVAAAALWAPQSSTITSRRRRGQRRAAGLPVVAVQPAAAGPRTRRARARADTEDGADTENGWGRPLLQAACRARARAPSCRRRLETVAAAVCSGKRARRRKVRLQAAAPTASTGTAPAPTSLGRRGGGCRLPPRGGCRGARWSRRFERTLRAWLRSKRRLLAEASFRSAAPAPRSSCG
mmetsp:Transcript_22019/g.50613  ORF Transcript_22019/g.50613 Transcript_22019/m.50613 type:complete len:242 (+) Transcript_22019:1027-1752(+)